MRRTLLPSPPNPDDATYGSALAFNRAVYDWMLKVKGRVEADSRVNDTPAGQQFLATNFTTNTVANGAATLPDLANSHASLVQVLTDKGLLSPTINRGS
jgi:hypothetical protein